MFEDMTSTMDQAGAGMKQTSPVIAQFYKGLRSEGLGRLDAALIVGFWVYALTGGLGQPDER